MAETATLITALETYLAFLETVDRYADERRETGTPTVPALELVAIQHRWSRLQTDLTVVLAKLQALGEGTALSPEQFLILCGLRRGT